MKDGIFTLTTEEKKKKKVEVKEENETSPRPTFVNSDQSGVVGGNGIERVCRALNERHIDPSNSKCSSPSHFLILTLNKFYTYYGAETSPYFNDSLSNLLLV